MSVLGLSEVVDFFNFWGTIIKTGKVMKKNIEEDNYSKFYSYCLWFVGLGLLILGTNLYSSHLDRQSAYTRWNSFINNISEHVYEYPYSAGLIIRDLTNNFSYYYQGNKKFISASLIKVPIMSVVFQKIHEGKLSLDDTIVLKRSHKVQGSGIIRRKNPGTVYTVEDLINIMIAESDNTAAKMLTEYIGLDEMNTTFKEIGLEDTNISIKSFNMTRRRVKNESFTTPYDMAYLLEKVYYGKFINKEISKKIIDILKLPNDNTRLSRYLPDNFELAHKTGLLRGACHDAGIVFTPRGAYLICIMTDQNRGYKTAKRFIANVGKLAYEQI